MKNILNNFTISKILFFSFLLRLALMPFFSDNFLVNEWAIIYQNFNLSGVLGYNVALNDYLAVPKIVEPGERVLPSVFMPPLYIFLILSLKFLLNDYISIAHLVIWFQLFLNLISIFLFYKILEILKFGKNTMSIFTFIFAFFPLNIYASLQISSITLQVFLLSLFFISLIKVEKNNSFLYLVLFSLTAGFLILTRGEFFLFYILTIFYFFIFLKFKIKPLICSIIISTIVISPYLKRNYENFDTLVLTKSLGYNLLKGNNPSFKVEGDTNFVNEFSKNNIKIKTEKNYEIKLDDFYKKEAIKIIKDKPIDYLKFYFVKLFSFILYDLNSTYPNYYNFIHLIPKIVVSLGALAGAIISLRYKGFFQFFSIFYLSNIFLFSVFFILPRYSLILLPIQLLLCTVFINYLKKFIN